MLTSVWSSQLIDGGYLTLVWLIFLTCGTFWAMFSEYGDFWCWCLEACFNVILALSEVISYNLVSLTVSHPLQFCFIFHISAFIFILPHCSLQANLFFAFYCLSLPALLWPVKLSPLTKWLMTKVNSQLHTFISHRCLCSSCVFFSKDFHLFGLKKTGLHDLQKSDCVWSIPLNDCVSNAGCKAIKAADILNTAFFPSFKPASKSSINQQPPEPGTSVGKIFLLLTSFHCSVQLSLTVSHTWQQRKTRSSSLPSDGAFGNLMSLHLLDSLVIDFKLVRRIYWQ